MHAWTTTDDEPRCGLCPLTKLAIWWPPTLCWWQ